MLSCILLSGLLENCGRLTFEYSGSKACSASMSAAVPPLFWTSAMACSANVVFPLLSGP